MRWMRLPQRRAGLAFPPIDIEKILILARCVVLIAVVRE